MGETKQNIWQSRWYPGRAIWKWLRPLFTLRMLFRCLFAFACLATFVALFYAEENWRGKRAWEQFKREWEAKGERFDLAAFISKPVPAEQNFADSPFFRPLFDYEYQMREGQQSVIWHDTNGFARAMKIKITGQSSAGKWPELQGWEKAEPVKLREWQMFYRGATNFPSPAQPQDPGQDVLLALGKFKSTLDELRSAADRPYSIFPLHYRETWGMLLAHLSVLKSCSEVCSLRAVAELEAGQTAAALGDVKLGFRLANALDSEPVIISQLVRMAIIEIVVQPVWQGMVEDRWSEPQLEELQKSLYALTPLNAFDKTIRAERAALNEFSEHLRAGGFPKLSDLFGDSATAHKELWDSILRYGPKGWVYQNQLLLSRLYQEKVLPVVNAGQHRVFADSADNSFEPAELKKDKPYNYLVRLGWPSLSSICRKFAWGQVTVDLSQIACALERFRLANGQFPENLDALVPRFMSQLPNDVITGESLKYRRTSDGQFVLYSVGWNEKDDGGVVGKVKDSLNGVQDSSPGDWVWQFPEK